MTNSGLLVASRDSMGIQTDQTKRHDNLINRFDYDGDYGTVLNRFLMQSAMDTSYCSWYWRTNKGIYPH